MSARTADQLASNLASLGLSLTAEQTEALDAASALASDYSTIKDSPGVEATVSDGASVDDWR